MFMFGQKYEEIEKMLRCHTSSSDDERGQIEPDDIDINWITAALLAVTFRSFKIKKRTCLATLKNKRHLNSGQNSFLSDFPESLDIQKNRMLLCCIHVQNNVNQTTP
uniref:Uncharacterized protein n=1 Tax=Romanomermis culicivorax TaxID=13658 RepID=A0A915HL60_ROMCU